MNDNLLVIIPCAGIGNRFSSQVEKQHVSLGDLSVIETTLSNFMMFKPASKIVVVVKDPESFLKKISIKLDERFSIVSGGNSRSESVLNGIRSENIEKYDYVMTHDGVRPFIDIDFLEKIYKSILDSDYDCIFYGIKPKDSIKSLEEGSCKMVERDDFILVQTPQICESKKLEDALEELISKGIYPTDESSAMEQCGFSINFIEGSQKNIKITYPEDLEKKDILIGNGFDLHRFCDGDSIVFGGVRFPFEFGIEAISDGDVILHSLADSILGALSEGDIGTAFPVDDPKSKDLDSRVIITYCLDLMKKRGYHLNNIDITVVSETPKISPIRDQIIKSLSEIFSIDSRKIGLKGSTMEKIGIIGKEQALAVMTSVTLKR
jgi:2-C-methyl-D-erythritol 4-phosphate cytidylyltransferase/2-C-methyl-D-erythritol 2,4-cyclodiphosphate synthase